MKLLVIIISAFITTSGYRVNNRTTIILYSCAQSRIHKAGNCDFTQAFASYDRVNDTVFSFKLQTLGVTYPVVEIDSCSMINKSSLLLSGYIYQPGNSLPTDQQRLAYVDIIQAQRKEKSLLIYGKHAGRTGQNGRFIIKADITANEIYLVIEKLNYQPVTVCLSLSR